MVLSCIILLQIFSYLVIYIHSFTWYNDLHRSLNFGYNMLKFRPMYITCCFLFGLLILNVLGVFKGQLTVIHIIFQFFNCFPPPTPNLYFSLPILTKVVVCCLLRLVSAFIASPLWLVYSTVGNLRKFMYFKIL